MPDASATYQWTTTPLSIATIRVERELQGRVKTDEVTVRRYADDMAKGDTFPSIQVAKVKRSYYVVDGFHRLEAARSLGHQTIVADVSTMTQTEATMFAINSNRTHGLTPKPADKRRSFSLYVATGLHLLPNGRLKSSRMIADELSNLVSHTSVRKYLKAEGVHVADLHDDDTEYKAWDHGQDDMSDEEKEDEALGLIRHLWTLFETTEDRKHQEVIRNALGPLYERMGQELEGTDYAPILNATFSRADTLEI
ncbi:hypothetical protein D3Y57_12895 [Sphingomonas paeninsulae]|uniref:ParB-like N-terminal domain-containing protein n=1 Tax=Sphingomonas paeninsulae TaxID=2319844 RepID=A0A494THB0_SPHPE|nr:ParB N-terminal domain-containing protein [Sphingomonas paeninsulae]AYJ86692.1 hypothetical protein D3Y57_12895 [Sphingomonas paeninsulae]